jgi:ArsR family transcriptional regulator
MMTIAGQSKRVCHAAKRVHAEGHVNTSPSGCAFGPAIVEARIVTTRLKSVPPAAGDAPRALPDLRPVEGSEADDELAALAKALGHPARVQIMRLLVRREACICGDIVDELPLAQSTVSQHLKVLKEVGLIRGDIDGPRVCYCVEPRTLRRLKALVGGL